MTDEAKGDDEAEEQQEEGPSRRPGEGARRKEERQAEDRHHAGDLGYQLAEVDSHGLFKDGDHAPFLDHVLLPFNDPEVA